MMHCPGAHGRTPKILNPEHGPMVCPSKGPTHGDPFQKLRDRVDPCEHGRLLYLEALAREADEPARGDALYDLAQHLVRLYNKAQAFERRVDELQQVAR